jgi:hypothetical protein
LAPAKRGLSKNFVAICILVVTTGANYDSMHWMDDDRAAAPDDIVALKEALSAEREREASATEYELTAEQAVAKTVTVRSFTRKRAERQTFPEHLPREGCSSIRQ